MPVSHISLTVSHLPRSCSFYLSALQPLGYHFIGQQDNKIGFGDSGADFFICQDSSEYKPGPVHIAFAAKSKEEVNSFYIAALRAGGTDNDKPTLRDCETGYYSASVIDFDDNAVEVVYRGNGKSMISFSKADLDHPNNSPLEHASRCESSPFRSVVERITTTITSTTPTQPETAREPDNISNSKALVGTLLGAAAGAAIAYVMTKEDSPKPTSQQPPAVARHTVVRHTVGSSSPQQPPQSQASVHDRGTISYASEPSSQSTIRPRAIEAALAPSDISSNKSSNSSTSSKSRRSSQGREPLPLEAPPTVLSESRSKSSCQGSEYLTTKASKTLVQGFQCQVAYPSVTKKPLAIEPPSSSTPEARNKISTSTVKPLAIEAPPSMISTSSTRRVSRRHPPALTYYTVKEYPAPSEIRSNNGSSAKASRSSHRSKASSVKTTTTIRTVRSAHTAADYILPSSTISVHTHEQHDLPLRDSKYSSRYTEPDKIVVSASRRESKLPAKPEPHEVELPTSNYGSKYTAEPDAYDDELSPSTHHTQSQQTRRPSSRHLSDSPHAEEMSPPPSASSRSSRNRSPHRVPLPVSTKTSFISRARSPPRSAASASTVRPLTARNVRRAATENGVDDLETVLPEDSISQMGSKAQKEAHRRFGESGGHGRRHRRRSDPPRSEGVRSHRSHGQSSRSGRKASTRVSMPRGIQRALGVITA